MRLRKALRLVAELGWPRWHDGGEICIRLPDHHVARESVCGRKHDASRRLVSALRKALRALGQDPGGPDEGGAGAVAA
jgi:hypothetical protein